MVAPVRRRRPRNATCDCLRLVSMLAVIVMQTTRSAAASMYSQQVSSSPTAAANFFMTPSDEAVKSISLRTTSGTVATCKFEYTAVVPLSARSSTQRQQQQQQQNMRGSPNTDIQSFLGRLAGVCIRRQFDYWKYEVCFEGSVTQSRGMGSSNDLGHFRTVDALEQVYDNGTPCEALPDRSGRRSRIEFLCDQDLRIRTVVEESTCAYKIVVGAPIVCGHPGFRSVQEAEQQSGNGEDLSGESETHEPWHFAIRESEGGQVTCSARSTLGPAQRAANIVRSGATLGQAIVPLQAFALSLSVDSGSLQPEAHACRAPGRRLGSREKRDYEILVTDSARTLVLKSAENFSGSIEFVNVQAMPVLSSL